jgi:DNA mismatch endonuclease (patch repair protein)
MNGNDDGHAPANLGPPEPPSDGERRRFARQRRRDTVPELALRSALHSQGLRYFVDRAPLPRMSGRADIVFPRTRVAVYVHGCFWHGCPEHGTWPRRNAEWWRDKIERNRARDRATEHELVAAGWEVITVWEHDDPDVAASRIAQAVRARRGESPA